MAKLIWAITCDRVITDQATNAVSYIDAIEQLAAPPLPAPFPRFNLATLWIREEGETEIELRFRIVSPKRKTLLSHEERLRFSPDVARHRLNMAIGGFTAEEEGTFLILVDQQRGKSWRNISKIPIEVVGQEPS